MKFPCLSSRKLQYQIKIHKVAPDRKNIEFKIAKVEFKMPGVKKLHLHSANSSKGSTMSHCTSVKSVG